MSWRCLAYVSIVIPGLLRAQVSVDLPLGLGVQAVYYDRINGVVLPYGPTISVGDDRWTVEPLLTYRSHLGKVDPSLAVSWHPDSALALSVIGKRGTFSTDTWIRSDLVNSLYAFLFGIDARNDFRGDRLEGEARLTLPTVRGASAVYAGVRWERDWSTGGVPAGWAGPYSVLHEDDPVNGMNRPNPVVNEGHLASAFVGGESRYAGERMASQLRVAVEGAWHTPLAVQHFQQVTFDEFASVRTWRKERMELGGHLLVTANGPAPKERYDYVGGSGTLETVDLLSMGGDHLYFADASYVIPIPGRAVRPFGPLFFAPRFATGAAGVAGFGRPTWNVGGRLGSNLIRVDLLIDPRTHRRSVGFGFTFAPR